MNETIFFIFGVQVGFWSLAVWTKLREIKDSFLEKQETRAAVVRTDFEAPRTREESSFIAEPKSPQMVEYEEAQELKRINPGRF